MKKDIHKENWEAVSRENQRIDSEIDQRLESKIRKKITPAQNFKQYFLAAAAVILLALGGYFLTLNSSSETSIPEVLTYTTEAKSQKVELADGSVILMEPHSQLVVGKSFGTTDRPIKYTGKGTFSIAKDKTRPFVINAQGFMVKVLGTKFYLDQTEGKQTVELHEGKVQITQNEKITYLLPNETWVQKPLELESTKLMIASDSRRFTFENESFEAIISKLEKEYGLEIEFPNKYRHHEIKGSVTGTIEEVITTLCYPLNLSPTKISSKKIELKNKDK